MVGLPYSSLSDIFLTFSEHLYTLPGWARYCTVGTPKRGDCKRPRLAQCQETDSSLGLPREEELGPPQIALIIRTAPNQRFWGRPNRRIGPGHPFFTMADFCNVLSYQK